MIGPYAIEAYLGKGSYGAVIKGRKEGEPYALKAMLDRGESAEVNLQRFQLEAEILRSLDHPRVPRLVETLDVDEVHYIVQDFITGYPLSYLVSTGYRFCEGEIKRLLFQLLGILQDLHYPPEGKDAVVHRDLRLSNVILHNDHLYLIDFGHARFLDPQRYEPVPDPPKSEPDEDHLLDKGESARQGQEPGFATYRLLRTEIHPRSDLFGAGIMAVDLFTNWTTEEELAQADWQTVLPMTANFRQYLKRLLSREQGFDSAEEARQALKVILKEE